MPDPDRGLFFFHNPKAGGSSINRVLGSLFPQAAHCPLIENTERDHQRRAGDYGGFRGYRYYAGHYGHDVFRAVADRHDPISNFRDPAARLLSLYNFYRIRVPVPEDAGQLDDLHPVLFAKRVDFHRFVCSDDPRIEIHTRNHHVRQLSGSAWEPGSRGDLAQATAMLDRMPWFFVCEHPERSQLWATAVFGDRLAPIPRDNVTGGQCGGFVAVTTMTAATRRVIQGKNALDAALHARAVRRLLRRTCEPPGWWPRHLRRRPGGA